MATCDNDRVHRDQPEFEDDGGIRTPDLDGAVLIRTPKQGSTLTVRADHDVHAAIVHGLASYVAGLTGSVAGRDVSLTRVVTDWADHDDGSVPPPSAVVNSIEIGSYSRDGMLGNSRGETLGYDGNNRVTTIVCTAFYTLNEVTVTVMCEDKIQRAGVRLMLEDAFSPVEWRAGFRLALPRYHGAIAEYLLVSAQQPDATAMAQAALWPLVMRLTAWCPVYRIHTLPLARPIVTGTITVG
jgi:hypothetical protein